MLTRFEILGPGASRPSAERIIFCDGTDHRLYRAETDLELSHWRPNKTPGNLRAKTSTEICLRFVERPAEKSWTVAVNNHIDVDGILSVYVLLHSEHALANRRTIIEAAEMGDFWGWGEEPAQRLFQGITQLYQSGFDGREAFERAFELVPPLIEGRVSNLPELRQSLVPLQQGVEFVESGRIQRYLISDRLAHYIIPREVAGPDDDNASYVPEFNEPISDRAVLWPQVRARRDAQRVCLVSTERSNGWFHDILFPGYLWADTDGLWQVPDFQFQDGMRSYQLFNSGLMSAVRELQRRERSPGQWGLGGTDMPLGRELQERFPLVARFVDERGKAAISQLLPGEIAQVLIGYWAD